MIYYHGYYNFLLFLKYQSKINTSLETRYFYNRSRDYYLREISGSSYPRTNEHLTINKIPKAVRYVSNGIV